MFYFYVLLNKLTGFLHKKTSNMLHNYLIRDIKPELDKTKTSFYKNIKPVGRNPLTPSPVTINGVVQYDEKGRVKIE